VHPFRERFEVVEIFFINRRRSFTELEEFVLRVQIDLEYDQKRSLFRDGSERQYSLQLLRKLVNLHLPISSLLYSE